MEGVVEKQRHLSSSGNGASNNPNNNGSSLTNGVTSLHPGNNGNGHNGYMTSGSVNGSQISSALVPPPPSIKIDGVNCPSIGCECDESCYVNGCYLTHYSSSSGSTAPGIKRTKYDDNASILLNSVTRLTGGR